MTKKLLAYCGLYCGACSFKVSFDENDRAHLENIPLKYSQYKNMPLEFCPGCRLENMCGTCDIKNCAEEKQLNDCSQCNEFPCEKLLKFNYDGIPHHAESIKNLQSIKQMGVEQWLTMQQQKWQCRCGAKYSWYKQTCSKCG